MLQRTALMIALGGLAAGCAKTESADLLTSGIYAAITATATGDGTTTVGATLYVDDPNDLNYVDLTGDDQLTVTSAGTEKPLVQSELGNIVSHTASFPGDAEGTQYTVDFERSIDAGAPSTTVTMPAAFTIAPTQASASRRIPLTITYSPAGTTDDLAWIIRGPCIDVIHGVVHDDPGALTIPENAITSPDGPDAMISPVSCAVTLTLTRERAGSLDPHYGKGGQALGEQVRAVGWTSTP